MEIIFECSNFKPNIILRTFEIDSKACMRIKISNGMLKILENNLGNASRGGATLWGVTNFFFIFYFIYVIGTFKMFL